MGLHQISYFPSVNTEPRIQNVIVGSEPIEVDKIYSVATKAYIANGNDGYSTFKTAEVCAEPCTTDDELDNLPVLKFVIIERLKRMNEQKKALQLECQGRIRNLERYAKPSTSSINYTV